MIVIDLIRLIPDGQKVLVRDYDNENLEYYGDDVQWLKQCAYKWYRELWAYEIKMVASENDCVREDYIIIEVDSNVKRF